MAATTLRDVVRCGGHPDPELREFAALGNHGKSPGNLERDFHRWHCKLRASVGVHLQPYTVRVPLKNPLSGKPDVEDINVLLPHEMFASVYSQGHVLWSDVMGSEIDADDFWMHELHKDWVQRHPVLTTGGIKRVVPIILH